MTDTLACSLHRRLFAIVYDALVVTAMVFIASVPFVLITGGAEEQSLVFRATLQLYELLVAFAFFGGFWHYGGQTVGMRAWRIRVTRSDGGRVRWRDAAVRYGVALISWGALGLGFLWSLVDHERRTWHDMASGTRLVHERR